LRALAGQLDDELPPRRRIAQPGHQIAGDQPVDHPARSGRRDAELVGERGLVERPARLEDHQKPELRHGDEIAGRRDRPRGNGDEQPGRGEHGFGDRVDVVGQVGAHGGRHARHGDSVPYATAGVILPGMAACRVSLCGSTGPGSRAGGCGEAGLVFRCQAVTFG